MSANSRTYLRYYVQIGLDWTEFLVQQLDGLSWIRINGSWIWGGIESFILNPFHTLPVGLVDELQGGDPVHSSPAQHQVVLCRPVPHQDRDLAETLRSVVAPLVLPGRPGRRADHQPPVLHLVCQDLSGRDKILDKRVSVSQERLEISEQGQQTALYGVRRRRRKAHMAEADGCLDVRVLGLRVVDVNLPERRDLIWARLHRPQTLVDSALNYHARRVAAGSCGRRHLTHRQGGQGQSGVEVPGELAEGARLHSVVGPKVAKQGRRGRQRIEAH